MRAITKAGVILAACALAAGMCACGSSNESAAEPEQEACAQH